MKERLEKGGRVGGMGRGGVFLWAACFFGENRGMRRRGIMRVVLS